MTLKEARIKAGYTQVELAARLGVSLSTFRLWEYGVSKPNRQNWDKIKEVFNELPFAEEIDI